MSRFVWIFRSGYPSETSDGAIQANLTLLDAASKTMRLIAICTTQATGHCQCMQSIMFHSACTHGCLKVKCYLTYMPEYRLINRR